MYSFDRCRRETVRRGREEEEDWERERERLSSATSAAANLDTRRPCDVTSGVNTVDQSPLGPRLAPMIGVPRESVSER